MPLIKSSKKSALRKNIATEMQAHPDERKKNLAIAYSVQRAAKHRAKKASGGTVESGSRDMNMAEGGEINAKNARRPMPENRYDDKKMISKNSGNKPPKHDSWTDNSTVTQAQANNGKKILPIKRPRMVPSDAFSTRLYDKEGNLQESERPGPYGAQPEADYDETGPNHQGPEVRDMQDEHSTKTKPYKKEIEDQYAQDVAEADMKRANAYAKGGEVEESDYDASPNKYEDDLLDLPPSEDEGATMAMSDNETDPDRDGPEVPDMEDEHSTDRKPYAGGGRIGDTEDNIDDDMELNPAHGKYSKDDSEAQPEDEEHIEDEDSIAAAIMAKKKRESRMSDSDMDEMLRLYEGGDITRHSGKILSHDSIDTDEDADQADLSRNADEDANEEDQLSFNALRKENYSESDGLDELDNPEDSAQTSDDEEMDSHDDHDMVSAIRKRMNAKRQFKQR